MAFAVVRIAAGGYISSRTAAAWDEPAHLAAGYLALSQSDYRLDPAHPPFLRMWAALPLLAMDGVAMPRGAADSATPGTWLSAGYRFARRVVHVDNDADRLLNAGRLMTQLLSVLLGAFVFLWAREWLGTRAAVFALVVYALEPNELAHGTVITTDLGVTCFIVGTLYFAWRLRRNWALADLAGFVTCIVLAVVSKFSAVLLVPTLAVIWLTASDERTSRTWRRAAAVAALTGAVTWGAVWAVYDFRYEPSDTPGWAFPLTDTNRSGVPSIAVRVVSALDRQHLLPNAFSVGLLDAFGSTTRLNAYLAGRYSSEGWWYYFPVAVLAKSPTPFILLVGVGAIVLVRRRRELGWSNLAYVLVPVAVFGLAAVASRINIGVRHVLPVYPFLVLIAGVGEVAFRRVSRRVAVPVVCGLGLLWAGELAAACPYPLTFFNVLAGGPENGHRLLADSNLGWGQGLKSLKHWMDDQSVGHVNLAYFGQADPAYYQIDFTALPSSAFLDMDVFSPPRLPGYVAISATTLTGVHLPPELRLFFAPFRTRQTDAVVGNSILIYKVDEWPVADTTSDPGGAAMHRRLADALLYGSRWPAGAIPHYERYLHSNTPDAEVLVNYGAALLQVSRTAEGMAALRRAVVADPASGSARLVLARVLLASRDLDGATEHGLAAVALRPDDPESYHLMGRVRLVEGERVLALEYLRQALELDPTHAATRELMAWMAVTPVHAPPRHARQEVGP